jgi:hypothetical protein
VIPKGEVSLELLIHFLQDLDVQFLVPVPVEFAVHAHPSATVVKLAEGWGVVGLSYCAGRFRIPLWAGREMPIFVGEMQIRAECDVLCRAGSGLL